MMRPNGSCCSSRRLAYPLLSLFVIVAALNVSLERVASAQTPTVRFSTLRFEPAMSPLNYFSTEGAKTLPHLSPAFGFYLQYAHRPLELENSITGAGQGDLIEFQVNMELMAAIGLFDWLELGVSLPIAIAQNTEGLNQVTAAPADLDGGIGDLRFAPKARLFTYKILSLGVSLPFTVPTGSESNFLSNGSMTFSPRGIVAIDWWRLGAALNAGVLLRENESFNFGSQGTVSVGNEFFFGVGGKFGLVENILDLVVDGTFRMSLLEQDQEEMAGEVWGGAKVKLPLGFTAGVGGGPGIGQGIGTPTFRVFGALWWAWMRDQDPDHDGIVSGDDECPNEPEDKDGFEDENGCPDLDNDQDGVVDTADRCPTEAEDVDQFQDDDGCPEGDNDQDGLADASDKCPIDAEDIDQFEDEDGCPDTDNDHDTLLDKDDLCPDKAEDLDKFADIDGCPDEDNDGDGIADLVDQCPTQPETFNEVRDEDGCPDQGTGPIQINDQTITVPPVFFANGKDKILGKSEATLTLVAEVLNENRWIKKVRIEGHTDDRGSDKFNLDLSQRRASSIETFLIGKGVAPERVEAQGFGESQPVEDNKTAAGRAKNRRVDFVIADPAPNQPGQTVPVTP